MIHKVRNEMAESIVPLRKKIKDNLTRQGMWNRRGLLILLREYELASETCSHSFNNNMLREIKVQIARRHQGGTPIPHPSA